MIVILIIWLIIGILLAALSSLMYYYNIIGSLGLTVILLLGIMIALASTFNFISWHRKWAASVRPYTEALKTMFTLIAVIGIIIFLLGAIGTLLGALDMYKPDSQMENTLLIFLIIGLFTGLGGIIFWIYVERSLPGTISAAITEQQRKLSQLKETSENIGADIKSRDMDVKKSIEDAIKIEEKSREELKR